MQQAWALQTCALQARVLQAGALEGWALKAGALQARVLQAGALQG
jgi:hypothetical protein